MGYGSQLGWREVGLLPSPRMGLKGATVDGTFYVSGGGDGQHVSYTNEVFSFDPVWESWASAGQLTFTRKWHAVAEIDLSAIPSANCSVGSKYIWLWPSFGVFPITRKICVFQPVNMYIYLTGIQIHHLPNKQKDVSKFTASLHAGLCCIKYH